VALIYKVIWPPKRSHIAAIINSIKVDFKILFDRGFELGETKYDDRSFGNWIIVLYSTECVIRFIQDRGSVSVDVGPKWASRKLASQEHFYSPKLIIDYLRNFRGVVSQTTKERYMDVDEQLKDWSNYLNLHYDEIVSFLNRDDFVSEEPKIKQLWKSQLHLMFPELKN